MAEKTVKEKIEAIVKEHCGLPEETVLKPEDRFVEDLGADSLDQVEMLMELEEEFNIEINDDEGEKLLTVKDAIDYVTARIAA